MHTYLNNPAPRSTKKGGSLCETKEQLDKLDKLFEACVMKINTLLGLEFIFHNSGHLQFTTTYHSLDFSKDTFGTDCHNDAIKF